MWQDKHRIMIWLLVITFATTRAAQPCIAFYSPESPESAGTLFVHLNGYSNHGDMGQVIEACKCITTNESGSCPTSTQSMLRGSLTVIYPSESSFDPAIPGELPTLNKAMFTELQDLTIMDNYALTAIGPNAFSNLTGLKVLKIAGSPMLTLQKAAHSFTGLHNLRVLDLQTDGITGAKLAASKHSA